VRAPVVAAAWEGDIAYRYGARLYVEEFFWEAHEVWEAVWKACPPNGVERRLLRGLIALANAALKVRMGRANAALRLIAEADELLGEAGASARTEIVMGVAVAPLRAAAGKLASAIRAGGGTQEIGRILLPLAAIAGGWTLR
jgi:predicted metal-dependent hydrolase